MRSREPSIDLRDLEIPLEPELEIQVIPEDPEEIPVIEGVHKRIQAEIHQEDKEAESMAEEMLEVPLEWNKVPDLIMKDKDVLPAAISSPRRSCHK